MANVLSKVSGNAVIFKRQIAALVTPYASDQQANNPRFSGMAVSEINGNFLRWLFVRWSFASV